MIDSTVITDPYIFLQDNMLSEYKCKEICKKFDQNTEQQCQGSTGAGIDLDIKNSKDINVSDHKLQEHWKEEDQLFHDIIGKGHNDYYEHLNNPFVNNFYNFTNPSKRHDFHPTCGENMEILDTGFQIQKTEPGKGYVWHDDSRLEGGLLRYLTFILYLNTVEEGWTQFYNGNQVSPVAGRLIFFPATWTYVHQGYPPKQPKYLMTGWMHTQEKQKNGKT
tara:strand:+ start:919 stop:1578 length:660 start_codon:yes stop_codon:yes gene_type:complete